MSYKLITTTLKFLILQKITKTKDNGAFSSGLALLLALNEDWSSTTEWYWAYLYALYRLGELSGNGAPYDIKVTLLEPQQGYIYGYDAKNFRFLQLEERWAISFLVKT